MDSVNMDQAEMYRNFMKWTEIYHRASEFQPSPAETLSGQDVEVEPATRHPATYCMPVPSGRVWDPCVVCKGKHPLWRCVVFKAKTPTQRVKVVADNYVCFSCLNGKHLAKDCPKGLKCSVPGCGKPHSVLLHGARGVVDSCDSCGRKKCPDERHAECPAIDAECRNCGRKGHFHRCCKNCPKLPVPMQPFPHFDPNDPRVQLQRTLDRLEEERTRKQMDADTWQLAMEEERARNSQPQTALDMLPSFLVQEL